ncbi:MAG TPA: NADH-quinone oxidoreductase subunit NuoH [Flavobacteriales bacterium]|nr:NADH-quinone oxidoreductase subunit NuoH [Flavobacteriales bacterium]
MEIDFYYILEKSVLVLVIFGITLLIATYSTYFERKIAAWLQDRVGPDRAGPWGALQPLADAGKMFFKEDFIPAASEKFLFILAPGIAMFTACMTGAVIPWGTSWQFGDRIVPMQIADLNVGILFVMGFVSMGVYGIMVGGWSSNNKYSLFGAIRASSQMISYELAMGICIITIVMMTGSLNIGSIVASQGGGLYGVEALQGFAWNIFYQPLAFIIFFTCALAECNRAPFDLAECESELIGGYHTEYGSMKLGFFLFAEYINMFISSAIITCLFFGGYNFPGMQALDGNWLAFASFAVFFMKIFIGIFVFMWIRWSLPRFRYDQLMHLGWKMLIPLALINMLVTGLVEAWNWGWFNN